MKGILAPLFVFSASMALFSVPIQASWFGGQKSTFQEDFATPAKPMTFTHFNYAWQSALNELPCAWASVRTTPKDQADFTCVAGQWSTVRLMLDKPKAQSPDISRVRLLWRAWDPAVNPAGAEAHLANIFVRHVVGRYVPKSHAQEVTQAFFTQRPREWNDAYVRLRFNATPHNGYVQHRLEVIGTGKPTLPVEPQPAVPHSPEAVDTSKEQQLDAPITEVPALESSTRLGEWALPNNLWEKEKTAEQSVVVEEPSALSTAKVTDSTPQQPEEVPDQSWFERLSDVVTGNRYAPEKETLAEEVTGQSASEGAFGAFQQPVASQPISQPLLSVAPRMDAPVEVILPEGLNIETMPNATQNVPSKNAFNEAYTATKALTETYEAVNNPETQAFVVPPSVPTSTQTGETNTYLDFPMLDESQWQSDLGVEAPLDMPVGLPTQPFGRLKSSAESLEEGGL